MKKTKQLFLFLLLLVSGMSWGQVTMVNYKFNDNISPETGSIGNPNLTFSITPSYNAGITGNSLVTGTTASANGAYVEITISTTGYNNIKISWAGRTSNTSNPGTWVLYGDSGSGYGTAIHTQSLSTSFSNTGNISLSSAFENNSSIKLKILANNPQPRNLRIDDLIIVGTAATSPAEINIKGNNNTITDGDSTPSTTDHTDYGTVATNTNVVRTYTIENTGSADLILTAPYVQLTLGGQGFTITQQPALTTIPSGQSTTFEVTFNSATANTFTKGIEVLSNDSDEATYNFNVTAIAQAPTPEINVKGNNVSIVMGDTTPSTTDHTNFGSNITNESIVRTFTIENTGTGVLDISNIQMNTGTKYTIGGITLPTTVAASSSTTFTVTFSSTTAGTFTDTITITNTDSDESSYNFAVTGIVATVNFAVGDISIIGISSDSPDSFTFVNWVNIPVDAELKFTDNSYTGTGLNTNENTIIWKNNTGSNIAPGTVILISETTTDKGSIISGTINGLANVGETILLYEGTSSNPYFIHGLSKGAWRTTGTVSNSDSYLPSNLNVTNGNIVLGTLDNYQYDRSRSNQEVIIDYRSIVNNPTNWTGSNTYFALSSTDFTLCPWWNGSVWSNGTGTDAVTSGVIKGAYNTGSNGAIFANDLTIKTGGSLTVSETNPITIHGNLYNLNSSSIIVENNGSILQPNNTTSNLNTGNISYNRTTTLLDPYDFVYWSSPVAGQNLQNISFDTGILYNYTFNSDSSVYNWEGIDTSAGHIMTNGIGYATRHTNTTATPTKTFFGVPNNGDINVTIKSNGEATNSATQKLANLIGNPYPSAINILNFYIDNSTKIHKTFHIWTHNDNYNASSDSYDTNDYMIAQINATNDGITTLQTVAGNSYNGFIPAGQGFFINGINNGTETVTFKNSQRVAGNNNQFYKNQQENNNVEVNSFKLNVTNPIGYFKQTYIAYTNITTNAFDNEYDYAYASTGNSNKLYSVLGNSLLGFQYRASFLNSDVFPLGFNNTVGGEFQLSLDSPSIFFQNMDIYLKDNLLNIYHNLKVSPYTFTEPAGVNATRFEIVYQSPLSTENPVLTDNVLVYKNENIITVKASNEEIVTVKIYDITGRKLTELNNVNSSEVTYDASRYANQVLLVQVTTESSKVITKKVL
jgi:hypothetical protein